MRLFLSITLTSFALSLAACSHEKSDPAPKPRGGTEDSQAFRFNEPLSLQGALSTGQRAVLANQGAFALIREFPFALSEPSDISLGDVGSVSQCPQNQDVTGPEIVLFNADGREVAATANTAAGFRAMGPFEFAGRLAPGKYTMTIIFHATVACQVEGASLTLKRVKGEPIESAPTPNPTSEPTPVPTPVPTAAPTAEIDSSLVGEWSFGVPEAGVEVRDLFSTDGKHRFKFFENRILRGEVEAAWSSNVEVTPHRLTQTVTAVPVPFGSPAPQVGDAQYCIYEITGADSEKTLKMECQDETYPVAFTEEAQLFTPFQATSLTDARLVGEWYARAFLNGDPLERIESITPAGDVRFQSSRNGASELSWSGQISAITENAHTILVDEVEGRTFPSAPTPGSQLTCRQAFITKETKSCWMRRTCGSSPQIPFGNDWMVFAHRERCAGASVVDVEDTQRQSIPDANSSGITWPVSIADEGLVRDISLRLKVTHPYIGDLSVSLIAPNGVEVVLRQGQGGSDDNFDDTYGFAGSTNANLTRLQGIAAKGEWRLRVADTASSDVGFVEARRLVLLTSAR